MELWYKSRVDDLNDNKELINIKNNEKIENKKKVRLIDKETQTDLSDDSFEIVSFDKKYDNDCNNNNNITKRNTIELSFLDDSPSPVFTIRRKIKPII